jgi:hypothetical protein
VTPSGVQGRINADGRMNWPGLLFWIDAMNDANYQRFNDWRPFSITDTGTPGCDAAFVGTDCGYNVDTATGELAHLWYARYLGQPRLLRHQRELSTARLGADQHRPLWQQHAGFRVLVRYGVRAGSVQRVVLPPRLWRPVQRQ